MLAGSLVHTWSNLRPHFRVGIPCGRSEVTWLLRAESEVTPGAPGALSPVSGFLTPGQCEACQTRPAHLLAQLSSHTPGRGRSLEISTPTSSFLHPQGQERGPAASGHPEGDPLQAWGAPRQRRAS